MSLINDIIAVAEMASPPRPPRPPLRHEIGREVPPDRGEERLEAWTGRGIGCGGISDLLRPSSPPVPIEPLPLARSAGWLFVLFAYLVAAHEAVRWAPWPVALLLVAGLPLALVVRWWPLGRRMRWTWFLWAKTYSVAAVACVLVLGGAGLISEQVLGVVIYGLAVVNILEACLKEYQMGTRVNLVAGLVIAATTPLWTGAYVDGSTAMYAAPMSWILAYTLWDFAFVYAAFRGVYAHHLAVLGAPLVLALLETPDVWFQARAVTLLAFLVVYNTWFPWFWGRLNFSPWRSERVKRVLAWASLVLAVGQGVLRWLPAPGS